MASSASTKERVILGLMTYGPDDEAGSRILTLEEFNRHLDYFQSQGYNEVDTARMYVNGKQEAWTRQANWKSRGLKLATKVFPEGKGWHEPTQLRKHFTISLTELDTDQVDIFYLHAPDRTVPFEDTLAEVNRLYQEGKFKQLGLSNYPSWEVAEIYNIAKERGWVKPTIYQAMYNALTREIESELIPCCRKYGLELVVYNPLAGGLFSGKIKSADLAPTTGRFADSYQWGSLYRERFLNNAYMQALQIIEEATQKHNLTMLETALRWNIHHSALDTKSRGKGGKDGVIIGVSNFEQLEGNLRDLEKGPLPGDVVEALDRAALVAKARAPVYWR
ncbi:aflatoxin B1 aldehyde reductase member 2 [Byssothecium circinans]|uniref:Aflatoxin B1 aldehyde reductase member 2 n=1 Tax=Byssothecium circinans TaxID=147558 RepID=A0A6A5UCH6_9PLEO|nr:aflatoxin B1 aldehyde reductase member 2 [Byssothecium circinans]